MMSLKTDDRLLISQRNQEKIGLIPIESIMKTNVNEIRLRHVLLIANTVQITLLRCVLPLADTVLTNLLLAALKLAGRKAGDSTLNLSLFVSSGILTIPVKIARNMA